MKRAAEEEERGEAAPWGSGLPDELYYELAEAVLGESLGGWVEALRALASLFSASTSLRARGARLFFHAEWLAHRVFARLYGNCLAATLCADGTHSKMTCAMWSSSFVATREQLALFAPAWRAAQCTAPLRQAIVLAIGPPLMHSFVRGYREALCKWRLVGVDTLDSFIERATLYVPRQHTMEYLFTLLRLLHRLWRAGAITSADVDECNAFLAEHRTPLSTKRLDEHGLEDMRPFSYYDV
jgi:hypothetical protein